MTPEQVQGFVRGELSRRARGAHAALLVASLAMATIVTSVWVTEPALPTRTHVAFLFVVVIAAAWATHAIWVLTRRAVLLVPHQVQAARLAMVCCLAFVTGCVTAWATVGGAASVMALVTSLVMFSLAVLNMRRARARHAALLQRRRELS
jgi:hypothetical protein